MGPHEAENLVRAASRSCGGAVLVRALVHLGKGESDEIFWRRTALLRHLGELSDPRAADALHSYLGSGPAVHWRTQAAIRLAELADLRAVPYLAERMRDDSVTLYGGMKPDAYRALARDDSERVVAARLLAELALLFEDQHGWIWQQCEAPVVSWLADSPQPHANGMRLLAIAGPKQTAAPLLRDWAFPPGPLPNPGQQPPMPAEWVVAQSALRYLGVARDEPSWPLLQKQLLRRKTDARDADISMSALMGGGMAMLGMSLRALGVGAADGLAEWGDPRDFALLSGVADDPKENEDVRMQACLALARVMPADKAPQVAQKVLRVVTSGKPADAFTAGCYLRGFARFPSSAVGKALLGAISPKTPPELRGQAAQVAGRNVLSAAESAALSMKLSNPATAPHAAVALLLGGSPEAAASAVATVAGGPPEDLAALREAWSRAFETVSKADLEAGTLLRAAQNAERASRELVLGAPQAWVTDSLSGALRAAQFDQGPGSATAMLLRYRLRQMAQGPDPAVRARAILVLRLLKADGLLALLGEAP
jgi:hypothetical protein